MKKFCLTITYVVLALMILSCNSSEKELISIVEELNEECPIDLGVVGEISKIKYHDGEATMTLIFDEDVPMNLTSLSNKTNILKTAIMSTYADNEDLNEVFKAVLNANASFSIKMKQKHDESQIKIELNQSDLNALINGEVEPFGPEEYLQMAMLLGNAQCPLKIDEYTILTSMNIESQNIVYYYEVDENYMDIDNLKRNANMVKQIVRENLSANDPSMEDIIDACKESTYGIVFKFVGDSSGKSFSIRFSSTDL